jgi:ADP-ribosylglycohydrolase
MSRIRDHIRAAILGAVLGDALGVPHEFSTREEMRAAPATGMTGYGSHQQPTGTWSDDSSMLLCTAESLVHGYDIDDMARRFLRWFDEGEMTPHGETFDFGSTTAEAMRALRRGMSAAEAGGTAETDNGNGSLMRILPVGMWAIALQERDVQRIASAVSGITHAHPRSRLACVYYSLVVWSVLRDLYRQSDRFDAHTALRAALRMLGDADLRYPQDVDIARERVHYRRLFAGYFAGLPESAIYSDGYVVHSLESAVWCVLTTDSYPDAVLKAVNLGGDTDTTACVAGGLAGLLYGLGALPEQWLGTLQNRGLVMEVTERFAARIAD